MGKLVLDEKEVNELMDTFDFSKSVYLQKLESIAKEIKKLDNVQNKQEILAQKLDSYLNIVDKFQFQNEKDMSLNYTTYLAFYASKLDELSQHESIKKIEKIVNRAEKINSVSLVKLVAVIAICHIAILAIYLIKI
ncbi:hypothetical protein FE246_07235 [Aliarcobacter thereius]|uniref:Uncharacterized protein n=1 Tax=Aliarcobacter thereius TaxID=544718 RepID=A0A5R9H4U3_9BACT|nr:hypothetical protein [Aliarcobacter thereius]TLS71398.1 hypothetical protein FE246_07235 [Aliarcobacter thereius]